jgi:hypothetical protein
MSDIQPLSMKESRAMIRALTLIMCLAFAVQGGRLAAEERLRDIHVLGIGISEFTAGPALALPYASGDVAQMADYFARQDFDSGKPLRAPRLLLNEKATKKQIERELADLPNWVGEGATAVILMSSHGERSGGKWYFAPHDVDVAHLEESCVCGKTIMQHVDALIAKKHCRVLMVLNTCYAGQIMTDAAPLLDKYRDPAKGGLIIMASCVPSQVSIGVKYGAIFDITLTQGMKLMLAHVQPTGSVSIKEIRRYLRREMQGNLRFSIWKVPGVEWPEQYSMVECSLSIPEELGLTWADRKFVVPVQNSAVEEKPSPLPSKVITPDISPVGMWVCARPLVKRFKPVTNEPEEYYRDEKGELIFDKLLLNLDKNGRYEVLYVSVFGKKETGEGSYAFHPGVEFSLSFGTGVDSFHVDKLNADEMVLRLPNQIIVSPDLMAQIGKPTAQLDPVYRFVRVKEKQK